MVIGVNKGHRLPLRAKTKFFPPSQGRWLATRVPAASYQVGEEAAGVQYGMV